MVLLRVRGLTRRPWIEGFDLDLAAGEVALLRAPSGAGKTLLLRGLADLDPLDGGEIELDGVPRGRIPAADWRRQVLYLHQDPVRLPGSVADNMRAVLTLAASTGSAADPPPGLEPGADVMRLSGGEMQRLALHRALALRPRVLLLDEATSALDDTAEEPLLAALRGFVNEGGAIVWVSHDADLGERFEGREIRL